MALSHGGQRKSSFADSSVRIGFSRDNRAILRSREDRMMVNTHNGFQAESGPGAWGAEDALRAGRRAEQARRLARAAQRSAASSLDISADSHDRTANAYDEAAWRDDRRADEWRGHAIRHREYAAEDRRMAQRLRRMADSDPWGFGTGEEARSGRRIYGLD
ncbi:hypothetical protein A5712_05950 [Mycobacterium sp. E2327]|nr:hypothetical protein A5712_05950 [Mycobacterium sp. E2327]